MQLRARRGHAYSNDELKEIAVNGEANKTFLEAEYVIRGLVADVCARRIRRAGIDGREVGTVLVSAKLLRIVNHADPAAATKAIETVA